MIQVLNETETRLKTVEYSVQNMPILREAMKYTCYTKRIEVESLICFTLNRHGIDPCGAGIIGIRRPIRVGFADISIRERHSGIDTFGQLVEFGTGKRNHCEEVGFQDTRFTGVSDCIFHFFPGFGVKPFGHCIDHGYIRPVSGNSGEIPRAKGGYRLFYPSRCSLVGGKMKSKRRRGFMDFIRFTRDL